MHAKLGANQKQTKTHFRQTPFRISIQMQYLTKHLQFKRFVHSFYFWRRSSVSVVESNKVSRANARPLL